MVLLPSMNPYPATLKPVSAPIDLAHSLTIKPVANAAASAACCSESECCAAIFNAFVCSSTNDSCVLSFGSAPRCSGVPLTFFKSSSTLLFVKYVPSRFIKRGPRSFASLDSKTSPGSCDSRSNPNDRNNRLPEIRAEDAIAVSGWMARPWPNRLAIRSTKSPTARS